MAFLFVLVLVLIVYGSLYPFSFSTQPPSAEVIETFLRSWRHIGGRGDLLGNVALFVPYGFLGMLALPPRDSALMRFALLLVVGFAVAAIECFAGLGVKLFRFGRMLGSQFLVRGSDFFPCTGQIKALLPLKKVVYPRVVLIRLNCRE